MQDIRKPYSRSKSDRDLSKRVEEFETHHYHEEDTMSEQPVHIPIKKGFKERRSIDQMDMYPSHGRRAYDNVDVQDKPHGRRESDDIVVRDPRTRYERKKHSVGTLAFIGTILAVVIGGSLLTFVFNRATVTIIPKHEDLSDFRQAITYAREGADTDTTVLYAVATSTLTKSKTLAMSETKRVEAKASGKIIIYNNYSSEPQRLIKNTRFESTAGKIYRINQSVTVPGRSASKPGSIEVTVYADEFGTAYNSSPSDFTIPGFKGSPQYSTFYARSSGSIAGGASGEQSSASLADINAAKDELALELAQEIKEKLSKQTLDGYVGMYSALDIVYVDNEQDVLVGNTPTYQVTATGYLMFAHARELAETIARSTREYEGQPVRVDDADKLTFTRKDADRLSTVNSLEVLTEGAPRIVFLADEDGIRTLVAGKDRSEFATLMKSVESIESAEISFSPLWLSSFPEETAKISVVESLPKR